MRKESIERRIYRVSDVCGKVIDQSQHSNSHSVHVPVLCSRLSCMQERERGWLDDDNLDAQWFTRAAINLCLKNVSAWKQNSAAEQSAPEHS